MLASLRVIIRPVLDALRDHRRSTVIMAIVLALTGGAIIPVARLAEQQAPFDATAVILDPLPGAGLESPGSFNTRSPHVSQQRASDALFRFALGCAISILALGILTGLTLGGARTATRNPEFALRRAVGGSRRQLFASITLEGWLLALVMLILMAPVALGVWSRIAHAWPGTWRAASTTVPNGLIVGLIIAAVAVLVLPYLVAPRPRLSGDVARPLSLLLPIAQVGVSLAILVSGGLMVRHARTQSAAVMLEAGTGQVVSLESSLEAPARSRQYRDFLARLGDSALIQSASLGSHGLRLGLGTVEMIMTDCGSCAEGQIRTKYKQLLVTEYLASPDTFRAPRMPVVAGRGLALSDEASAQRVVVVSQSLANVGFENGEALGREIRLRTSEPGANPDGEWFRVVGVVDDYAGPGYGTGQQPPLAVFLSVLQHPAQRLELVVQGTAGIAEEVRRIAHDTQLTVTGMVSEEEVVLASQGPTRWFGGLFTLLGGAMLLIGGIGSLVVMRAWLVTLVPELGLRRAVGATRFRLILLVLGRLAVALGAGGGFAWYVAPGIRMTLNRMVGGDVGSATGFLVAGMALLALGALAGILSPLLRAISQPPAVLMEHTAE